MTDPVAPMDPKAMLERIEAEHRGRARTLSELANKLISKRKGQLPKTFEEWLQDIDTIKRVSEHVGASQAVNEMRIIFAPEPPK